MSLYTTLKEIYFSLDHGDRRLLDSFSLSVPRFYLLKHIDENPGISLTQLSTLMLTDKSNITRLIKSVEAKDLVSKQPNATDGRALSLYLTESGKSLLEEASAAHFEYTRDRFAPVEEQVNSLLRELGEVKQVLEEQLE